MIFLIKRKNMKINFGKIIYLMPMLVFLHQGICCYDKEKELNTTIQQKNGVTDFIWQAAFEVSKKETDKYCADKWLMDYTNYPVSADSSKKSIESFLSITDRNEFSGNYFNELFKSPLQALSAAENIYFPVIHINICIWQRISDINKLKIKDFKKLDKRKLAMMLYIYEENFDFYYSRMENFYTFITELEIWIKEKGGNSEVYKLSLNGLRYSIELLKKTRENIQDVRKKYNAHFNETLTDKLKKLKYY